MCIGPFAQPRVQTPPAPAAPPAPVGVPQNIVSNTNRSGARKRAALAGGGNRTLLAGALASPPSTGSSLLGG